VHINGAQQDTLLGSVDHEFKSDDTGILTFMGRLFKQGLTETAA